MIINYSLIIYFLLVNFYIIIEIKSKILYLIHLLQLDYR